MGRVENLPYLLYNLCSKSECCVSYVSSTILFASRTWSLSLLPHPTTRGNFNETPQIHTFDWLIYIWIAHPGKIPQHFVGSSEVQWSLKKASDSVPEGFFQWSLIFTSRVHGKNSVFSMIIGTYTFFSCVRVLNDHWNVSRLHCHFQWTLPMVIGNDH